MHRPTLIAALAVALAMLLIVGTDQAPKRAQASASAVVASDIRDTLNIARQEAARARERAAVLDRQARDATRASQRATFAAAALAARVQQAEAALAGAEASLALAQSERRALDARLARERAPVTQLLAGLQTLVRRPALLTLLQPGSIEDAVHVRAAVAAVVPQIDERTVALRRALNRVVLLEREAVTAATQRRQFRAELEQRRRDLATASAAERLKAQRAAGAADREAGRAYAIGEEARDLAAFTRRLTTRETFASGRSRAAAGPAPLLAYRLPVGGAMAAAGPGEVKGLTLVPRPGALAVAPAAGRVAFAGPYRGYGRIVIIEHADGWTSLVTGLSSLQVTVEQRLVAGSPLGEAPARNPQIGLELRHNGERMNPLDQLR